MDSFDDFGGLKDVQSYFFEVEMENLFPVLKQGC